jgi:hypothetical protein
MCENPDDIPEKINNEKVIKKTTIVSDEYIFQSLEYLVFQHVLLIDVYANSLSQQQLNQYTIDDGLLFWMEPFHKQWCTFQFNNYSQNNGIINAMISVTMDTMNMKTRYHIDINGFQYKNSGNSNTYYLEGHYTMSQTALHTHSYKIYSTSYIGVNNIRTLHRNVHYNIKTENDKLFFQGDTMINTIQNIAIIGETRYNEKYFLAIPIISTFQQCNEKTLPVSGRWEIRGISEPVFVTFGLNEDRKKNHSCDADGYLIEWSSGGDAVELFIQY